MAALTETQFQKIITDMADDRGILWHHCDAAYRCSGHNGFPDLILVKDIVLFVELKSWYGRLRPEQSTYRERLDYAGANYALWRPRDLFNGVIEDAMNQLDPKD